jgi:hypothetical protein
MKKTRLVLYTIIVLMIGVILGQLAPLSRASTLCIIDLPGSRADLHMDDNNTLSVRVYLPYEVTQVRRQGSSDVIINIQKK